MTPFLAHPEAARNRSLTKLLPREHGFWAILGIVISSALSCAVRPGAAWLVAVAVGIGAIAFGGIFGSRIRRSAAFQVAAAGALSLAGIPVELAGGTTLSNAALDACVWVAVFTACALSVRACFARTSRRHVQRSTRLALGSAAVPLGAAVVFAELSLRGQANATLVAGAGVVGIALWRPTAKQLKPVGIWLLTIAAVAAVALRLV